MNLDNAASTSALLKVWEAVERFVPWYSSVHRGSGVRNGCFCAQPLIMRLLGIPEADVGRLISALREGRRPQLPGSVRASLGIGSTRADVDRLVCAVTDIAEFGPRARYRHVPELDEYRPVGRSELPPQLRSVVSGAAAA